MKGTKEQDRKKANSLALQLAELFSKNSETCSPDFMRRIDIEMSKLMKLVEMINVEVRIEVAKRLSVLSHAPENTIITLANDDPEVAAPVLRKSTVLSAEEIIRIAKTKGNRHRIAIAQREGLPVSISDTLIEYGNRDVQVKVASNRTTDISDQGFKKLLETAKGDEEMQSALADRYDMSDDDIFTLVSIAVVSIRHRLVAQGALDDLSLLPVASQKMAEEITGEYWLSQYDFETAFQKYEEMFENGTVTERDIINSANAERFADTVAAFSFVTGVGREESKRMLTQIDVEPFIEVAKAARLKITTVFALLHSGPWQRRLTDDVRVDVMQYFQRESVWAVPGMRS
ncbi:DUF2336 domain-containing protein [Roseibium sp. RKSG952]|uniref:DUF2336 domain-containing protein n=1 Tax=Roseibium sp. RKSG952 TaxID=2529384 RepID=UPI0012BC363D|nr:DUF2336 domain-containing protein [Roseibium sp. RKSG952]MTH95186.1 DUF2336 domain-containing protein [Roseibium sp. RKSG952]